MPWISLSERFNTLPLILAGPILRRADAKAVTVWLAIKEPRYVTLRIYTRSGTGELEPYCEGTQHTIRLGDHLHLIAVTARANSPDRQLEWGGEYYYNLFFHSNRQDSFTAAHLNTPGILLADPDSANALSRLVYSDQPLPGFVLPPNDLNRIKIIHGSCRKAHGVGRDMLSDLDLVIETALREGNERPQQLFLTGDQIYADDVGTPLLVALIDAGCFLFSGNEEEILPTLNLPAHKFAPRGRSDIVRNRALLTTTTPHNHLLALNEYAAMYLFVWSGMLWPQHLPSVEEFWHAYPEMRPASSDLEQAEALYTTELERLDAFRSTLPHLRRALANIPTYMICDDHEITDDWYLDGAWCRQVLASPPGRRVVRNGLLAYTLFQGWGNTPEQFVQQSGKDLLMTLDSWRGGDEQGKQEKIEALLGLPKVFSGIGQLARPEPALSFHYTYHGPCYQVIVLDTRTQRLYRSPGEFPGLLSPEAMHNQITSTASPDANVTLIISASPVLGVDFVESIQFWSRWHVRENYAYDREAWSLEWATFQHLLRTVSALKRVVFLSGDVHYAFGASLQYWDIRSQTTARLVNYTSSPLCNEGSGSQIAVLAIGYPRLLRMLRKDLATSLTFFAWDIPHGDRHILNALLPLIRKRIYLFWWAIPRLIAAHRSPYEIILPAHGWLKGAFHSMPPDRSYHLHYLHNTFMREDLEQRQPIMQRLARLTVRITRPILRVVTFLETSVQHQRNALFRRAHKTPLLPGIHSHSPHALTRQAIRGTDKIERKLEKRRNSLVATLLSSITQQELWKVGELIVGYNNIGEIGFIWNEQQQEVTQRLWWRYNSQEALHMTEYRNTLVPPSANEAPPLP